MHPLFGKADTRSGEVIGAATLFNFHEVKLADGISRLVLPGANKP